MQPVFVKRTKRSGRIHGARGQLNGMYRATTPPAGAAGFNCWFKRLLACKYIHSWSQASMPLLSDE